MDTCRKVGHSSLDKDEKMYDILYMTIKDIIGNNYELLYEFNEAIKNKKKINIRLEMPHGKLSKSIFEIQNEGNLWKKFFNKF